MIEMVLGAQLKHNAYYKDLERTCHLKALRNSTSAEFQVNNEMVKIS